MAIRIGYGEWFKGVQIILRKQLSARNAKKKSKYGYDICSDCGARHSEHYQCKAKKAKREKDGA